MSVDKGFRFLHTTEVPIARTASEMMTILGLMGASNISMQMENGEPCGMTFDTMLGNSRVSYKIPVRWLHIHADLLKINESKRGAWVNRPEKNKKALEQAKRTVWRIALEWLKVQCAFVQNGVKSAGEVFLSDMIVPNGDGKLTVGEMLIERGAIANLHYAG